MLEDKYPNSCISCGFLGKLVYMNGLHEVRIGERLQGNLPKSDILWCFRRAPDQIVHNEVNAAEEELLASGFTPTDQYPSAREAAVRQVLEKPRPKCVESQLWYAWVETFDPRWHYEDWVRQTHATMTADALAALQDIQSEHVAIIARAERETTRFNKIVLILSLVVFVLALATFAYPNGVAWVVDLAPGAVRTDDSAPAPTPSTADAQP